MRKVKHYPKEGQVRIIKKFLWRPKVLLRSYQVYESRWLETAHIKQEYHVRKGPHDRHSGWRDKEWNNPSTLKA